MQLTDILSSEAVVPALRATSKKQLLQELAQTAAKVSGLDQRIVFETLLQREKLGSTGLGQGIAIPHGKFAALKEVKGVFARLLSPVDFEAADDRPVDLVFLLMAPESAGADHLKALARISRLLRDQTLVAKLRGTHDAPASTPSSPSPAPTPRTLRRPGMGAAFA